jgi:hypothetical protein
VGYRRCVPGPEEWLLYVDESGDFVTDRTSCVVGLVLRDRESPALEATLREVLSQCFPLIPWPPHAAHLNVPVSRAAACLLTPGDDHPEVREACSPALRRLRSGRRALGQGADDALGPFFEALDAGRMPSFGALAAADGWLRREDRRAYGRLSRLAGSQRAHLAAVLASLVEHYGQDAAFLVGAAQRGQLGPSDAYLSGLGALLERLFALLEGEARRVIRFRVATRDVMDPGYGVALPLRSTDVLRVADEVGGSAEVRVVPNQNIITRYDRHVSAGVVLADFLANRARLVLRRDISWDDVSDGVAERTGLLPQRPLETASGAAAPAVAHDGEARDWLKAVAAGRSVPRLAPTEPRWAREQAEILAALLPEAP